MLQISFRHARCLSLCLGILVFIGCAVLPSQAQDLANQVNLAAAPAPQFRLRVTIPGIPGDGEGRTIDAFSFENLINYQKVENSAGERVHFGPIAVTKAFDSATPALMRIAATGEHIKEVQIEFLRPDAQTGLPEVYARIKLTDVLVYSIRQQAPKPINAVALEEIAFDFSRIEFTYYRQDGSQVIFRYDLKPNKQG